MKYLVFLFLLSSTSLYAQQLTLPQCYALAEQNYPLIKQRNLIEHAASYTLDNLNKSLWPQVNMQVQGTTQSEVTKINIPIPNVTIPSPSYQQYKVTLDIAQPITDLFLVKSQKEVVKQNREAQLVNNEVDVYKIRERINQLYLGSLLLDEQLRLNNLVDKDLEDGKGRVEAAIKNGVDYRTSLDKIEAQRIQNKQRKLELQTTKTAYLTMLGMFLNQNLNEQTMLEKPAGLVLDNDIRRPELNYLDAKIKGNQLQEATIRNKAIPKLSVFAQLGFGNPNPLNFLNASLSPFAIGGLRATWNFNTLLFNKNDIHLLRNENNMLAVQKEVFLFNIKQQMLQQNQEIQKLQQLLQTDDELINLRSTIKTTAKVQLENGIISTNDFIREVNAEDQSRQNKLLHQIQLLTAQYAVYFTKGQ